MFLKPRKNRSYQYTPRFYDPDKERQDDSGRVRRPLRFRRSGARASSRSVLVMVILMAIITYILYKLAQIGAQ